MPDLSPIKEDIKQFPEYETQSAPCPKTSTSTPKDLTCLIKSKLDKTSDNENKERVTKYKKALEDDLEKLKNYARDLHSEEENDERDAADDSTYDFDDDFDDYFEDDEEEKEAVGL